MTPLPSPESGIRAYSHLVPGGPLVYAHEQNVSSSDRRTFWCYKLYTSLILPSPESGIWAYLHLVPGGPLVYAHEQNVSSSDQRTFWYYKLYTSLILVCIPHCDHQ